MNDFLNIFMIVYEFMRDTTILSFNIGDSAISITFLQLAIGSTVCCIGIEVLHHIFDW